jgi:Domain of unknown function (DUF4062)
MARTIKVFFASPGDLEEERHLTIETLRNMSSQSIHDFKFLGYENVLATTGTRPQDVINTLIDQCDVFIAVFFRRWGQSQQDTVAYTSYTEEEFARAKHRFLSTGSPEIFCFFKQIDLPSLSDPGKQLNKVLEFKSRLEQSHKIFYRPFSTAAQFADEIEQHLTKFVEGKLPIPRNPIRNLHIPIVEDQKPDKSRSTDLAKVNQAITSANSGHLEEATILMAGVSQTTRDIGLLDTMRKFYEETNNPDASQAVLEKKITLLRDRRLAAHEYLAVLMPEHCLNDLISNNWANLPQEKHQGTEKKLRKLFSGTRFHELMIESMAKYFTVGELIALTNFYRGDGASIKEKADRVLGNMLPEILTTLAEEDPELFKD